jgi:hypothetical protein
MTVNRKRFHCVIPGLAAVLSIAACSSQVHWKGTVVEDGDVTVVKNPKEPLYQTPILELREELSLGGPDAEGDYAFVQIRGVAVDNDGTIYVLDPGQNERDRRNGDPVRGLLQLKPLVRRNILIIRTNEHADKLQAACRDFQTEPPILSSKQV